MQHHDKIQQAKVMLHATKPGTIIHVIWEYKLEKLKEQLKHENSRTNKLRNNMFR